MMYNGISICHRVMSVCISQTMPSTNTAKILYVMITLAVKEELLLSIDGLRKTTIQLTRYGLT